MIHISSDVSDQSGNLKSRVITGKTSRQEVHKSFGGPFINIENPPIEIYRPVSGREADVQIALVPFWIDTEEVILYMMVTYDENDIVKAVHWDTFKHVGSGYLGASLRRAKLESEGFFFAAVKGGAGQAAQGNPTCTTRLSSRRRLSATACRPLRGIILLPRNKL